MTETEWLTARDPWGMLEFVREHISKRKFRLFTCACCRGVLNPFAPPVAERALAAAEAFADRAITGETLDRVAVRVGEAAVAARDADYRNRTGYHAHLLDAVALACWSGDEAEAASDAALATARAAADIPWPATTAAQPPELAYELAVQAEALRDIAGNPFRSSGLEPEWLTDTVVGMAKAIYDGRAFDQMPVLADALQDAGCDDDAILAHCRQEGEHVRGCWVVDLLLGKS